MGFTQMCKGFKCAYIDKYGMCQKTKKICSEQPQPVKYLTCEKYYGICTNCVNVKCKCNKKAFGKNEVEKTTTEAKVEKIQPLNVYNKTEESLSERTKAIHTVSFADIASVTSKKEVPLKGKSDAYIIIDGSFRNNKYSYGGFLFSDGEKSYVKGTGNNEQLVYFGGNAGKVVGTMKAVQIAKKNGIKELTIYYDLDGIEKWATGEWKASKPWTIEYKKFMESSGIVIHYKKIRSRSCTEATTLAMEAFG